MASLTDRINDAIQDNNTLQERVPIGFGPVLTPARTYTSPADSYENELGYNNPTVNFSPGAMRGMWQVADQQQANVPVTNLTKSGNSTSNQLAGLQGGIPENPRAPATVWSSIPQMIQSFSVTGPVIIQANVSVHSSVANDKAGFAIYRDGQPVGNRLVQTLPATVSASTIVQLTTTDNAPTGRHLYSMEWSPGTGTLVATSNYRNLTVVNLSPQ